MLIFIIKSQDCPFITLLTKGSLSNHNTLILGPRRFIKFPSMVFNLAAVPAAKNQQNKLLDKLRITKKNEI